MRNEYPRPNFQRQEWLNLNGEWDFSFDNKEYRKINVPFCYESILSGIGIVEPHNYVYYKKSITIPSYWGSKNIKLNFGAVDYFCKVYVNSKFVGSHEGGSCGFSFDITKELNYINDEIYLEVFDPCDDESIPRGKQSWLKDSHAIWYTRTTGIWQTVWLEPVNEKSIASVKFTPDIDKGMVEVDLVSTCIEDVAFTFTFKNEEIFKFTRPVKQGHNIFSIDIFENKIFRSAYHNDGWCWTPNNPNLFYVNIDLNGFDEVNSYFGMRKIETKQGRVYLNNRPFYQKLILDQGYWSDGIMTAPSDDALKADIELAKEMGFNGCRKHQKTEDPRFLYWADKLGYVIWSEVASHPQFNNEAMDRMKNEWVEMVNRDYNSPSIVAYVPINESWGVPNIAFDKRQQSYALSLYYMLKAMDTTRLVISNDGWELTKSDVCAFHSYEHGDESNQYKKDKFQKKLIDLDYFLSNPSGRDVYADGYKYEGEPILLTEFGGMSIVEENSNKAWGYTASNSTEDFLITYKRILETIYKSPFIFGYCYTQLTDVEQEANGLLTAERKFKVPAEKIKEINDINN
ncbi:MAG: glycoside hydrolase family 2 protein [Lachnospirales bacterium]